MAKKVKMTMRQYAYFFRNLDKTVYTSFRKNILPAVVQDMQGIIQGWDTAHGRSRVGNKNKFVIRGSKSKLSLKQVAKYASDLIAGVKDHGPVYIGKWAENNSISSLQRADGTYSKFTQVGGKNSRIKLNNSQRDFWNPVLDDYFGADGKGVTKMSQDILKEARRGKK